MNPITVLLVEDHAIVREGLRMMLSIEKDIAVTGEASDGREAIRLARELRPEVIVMDIAMPLLNGLEATRQIIEALPGTRILILSAHSDDAYVERMMSLGAAGYLIKQTAAHVLPDAIRTVHRGKRFFSPAISRRLDSRRKRSQQSGAPQGTANQPVRLTSRESEVLQLIAEGKANKETAAELGISIKTVEKHRQSLMNKLDIHDTAGLTRHAIAAGIIESSVQVTTLSSGTGRDELHLQLVPVGFEPMVARFRVWQLHSGRRRVESSTARALTGAATRERISPPNPNRNACGPHRGCFLGRGDLYCAVDARRHPQRYRPIGGAQHRAGGGG